MKYSFILVLLLVLVPAGASQVAAENSPDAAQTADNLRLQLLDNQAKEAELQARSRSLEEDIKPENIERSLAGVGSTKPEELREFRRRQLSIELEGVRNQLKLLAANRERLESSIRTADARAYQQSADGARLPVTQAVQGQQVGSGSRLLILAAAGIAVLGIGLLLIIIRKPRVR